MCDATGEQTVSPSDDIAVSSESYRQGHKVKSHKRTYQQGKVLFNGFG